jgi:hypothetical protein
MYAQIALVLTAIYWAVAALGAWLADPGPGAWIDFRWEIAFLFYAFPATLILWTTFAILTKRKRQVAAHALVMIGIAIPVVWATTAFGSIYVLSGSAAVDARMRRINRAQLIEFYDEPLIFAYGQIGVRLRYQVNYPLGLKDIEDAAHAEVTDGRIAGFFRTSRSVSPSLEGEYPAGVYTFTEEFVPAFLPKEWNPVGTPREDNQLCFTYTEDALRQLFLAWPPARLRVRLYLSNAPIFKDTQNVFNFRDLVASAQRLGFRYCKR